MTSTTSAWRSALDNYDEDAMMIFLEIRKYGQPCFFGVEIVVVVAEGAVNVVIVLVVMVLVVVCFNPC